MNVMTAACGLQLACCKCLSCNYTKMMLTVSKSVLSNRLHVGYRERKVLEGEVRQMQEDMQALVEADMEAQQVCKS